MQFYRHSYIMLGGIYPPEGQGALEKSRFKTWDYSEMHLKNVCGLC
jgi:hypothetical protein